MREDANPAFEPKIQTDDSFEALKASERLLASAHGL
jgi:hypothetical protein